MHEFEIIQRYFSPLSATSAFVQLGQGDDCALFKLEADQACAVSTDTLVSGVHFLPELAPERLAQRALAVNLSDLAAMGARARAFLLALTLPSADADWLHAFSQGLAHCARTYGVSLMGGDTTRGPLSLTLTVFGEVPRGQALCRAGAQIGDDLWVSGVLGAAWCGLQLCTSAPGWLALSPAAREEAMQAFDLPTPRLALGETLRELGATAALDVSDGVASDACHLARGSACTLQIHLDQLPIFTPLRACAPDRVSAWRYALTGGDDYELLFTAPPSCRQALMAASATVGVPLTRMGQVCPAGPQPLQFVASDQEDLRALQSEALQGFNHFAFAGPSSGKA